MRARIRAWLAVSCALTWALPAAGEDPDGFWSVGLGPFGGLVNSVALNSEEHLFVATGYSGCNGYSCGRNGVFRSTDFGASWARINQGLSNTHVNSLVVDSADTLFAGTYFSGVYLSADDGDSWERANDGFPSSSIVDSLAVDSDDVLFAGTRAGQVYRSMDGGGSWSPVLIGVGSIGQVFVDSRDTVFVATFGALRRSADGGESWSSVSSVAGYNLYPITETAGGALVAGEVRGVFRSEDGGLSWQLYTAGLPGIFPGVVSLVEAPNGDLIAGLREEGLYRSTDGGASWQDMGRVIDREEVVQLVRTESDSLFAATDGGMFRSDSNGASWVASNQGLWNSIVGALLIEPSGVVLAGTDSGVERSQDGGRSWARESDGLPSTDGVWALFRMPDGALLAGTESEGIYRRADDDGQWTPVASFPSETSVQDIDGNSQGILFAATGSGSSGDGVFKSLDGGDHWSPANSGLSSTNVQSVLVNANDVVFAAAGQSICRSIDSAASWSCAATTSIVWDLALDANGHVLAASWGGVLRSKDEGLSWEAVPGAPTVWAQSIASSEAGSVYVGLFNLQPTSPSLLRFDDDGTGFAPDQDGQMDNVRLTALSLVTGPTGEVYAGLSGGGVVPEPRCMLLQATALLVLAGMRGRRQSGGFRAG